MEIVSAISRELDSAANYLSLKVIIRFLVEETGFIATPDRKYQR